MFQNKMYQLSESAIAVLRASNEMDSTLLITGSTGTGKSHLAQAIHRASLRSSSGRWFKVNLATLSENLIESELFGHERGAFTGADARRLGKLEAANGGTIFLDEIGELSPRLQAKLLDFIQYRRISPVGSNREIELNVRIIAATNRNLEAAVRAGDFRADLYHRLNVFHIKLPDLSLNPKAAVLLAREFLEQKTARVDKKIHRFARDVERLIRCYGWPGNVRELENMVEFAVAMASYGQIEMKSLPPSLQQFASEKGLGRGEDGLAEENDQAEADPAPIARVRGDIGSNAIGFIELPFTLDFHETKESFEKAYLEQALKICKGQINLTSRRIGLNKVSLTGKIKKFSIDWRKIRHETSESRAP